MPSFHFFRCSVFSFLFPIIYSCSLDDVEVAALSGPSSVTLYSTVEARFNIDIECDGASAPVPHIQSLDDCLGLWTVANGRLVATVESFELIIPRIPGADYTFLIGIVPAQLKWADPTKAKDKPDDYSRAIKQAYNTPCMEIVPMQAANTSVAEYRIQLQFQNGIGRSLKGPFPGLSPPAIAIVTECTGNHPAARTYRAFARAQVKVGGVGVIFPN